MTDHPITPPPELVQQWSTEGRHQDYCTLTESVAARAAQWGADRELEACIEHLKRSWTPTVTLDSLQAARRPKSPSLKEQALAALSEMSIEPCVINRVDANASVRAKYDIIRRALEALPND
jgi:hypothetical protein